MGCQGTPPSWDCLGGNLRVRSRRESDWYKLRGIRTSLSHNYSVKQSSLQMDALDGIGHACGHNLIGIAGMFSLEIADLSTNCKRCCCFAWIARCPAKTRHTWQDRPSRNTRYVSTFSIIHHSVICWNRINSRGKWQWKSRFTRGRSLRRHGRLPDVLLYSFQRFRNWWL